MPQGDRWWAQPLVLAASYVAGITALLVVCTTALYAMGKMPPAGFSAVIGSGIGALATLLVSHREDGSTKK